MTLEERRWAEIQLYFMCEDIYNIRKEMEDVAQMIEVAAQVGIPNQTRIGRISMFALEAHNKPTNEELVHLAHQNDVPIVTICKYVHKSRRTVHRMLKQEPPLVCPRFSEEDDQHIFNFLKRWKDIKEVGIV